LRWDYTAFAPTSDGLYALDKSCYPGNVTSVYRVSELHEEPEQLAGPWEFLCARAMAVDDSGSIWLLGSVTNLDVELDDVLLRVEDGRPRIVHQVRSVLDEDDPSPQTYTQMTIVDGFIYLSNPLRPKPLVRVHETEHGFVEERLVPSKCLSVPPPPLRRKYKQSRADLETTRRLHSAGVVRDYYAEGRVRVHIMPYHAPLDTVVDLIIELLPADGTHEIVFWANYETEIEPLGRLPSGFSIADVVDEARTQELRRRFPKLDPAKR
jgi:hypothetical protein